METYLFLNNTDKAKLQKLAQSKNLSLSTAVDIIYKLYYFTIAYEKSYFNKGNKQIHIKIKNDIKHPVNCLYVTNAVYGYLHKEYIKSTTKEHLLQLDRKIQSQMDKTYDPSYNKNQIIRELYRNRKALTK